MKDYSKMSLGDLEAERRKLAKRANQRMLRLERAGIDKFAYEKAQAYLHMTGGRRRFYERKSIGNINAERREIAKLNEFLNSVSSTRRGLQNKYKKAYETLKERNPDLAELSFADYLSILENWSQAKKSHAVGSLTILKTATDAINRGMNVNEFMSALEDMTEKRTQRFLRTGEETQISEKGIKSVVTRLLKKGG